VAAKTAPASAQQRWGRLRFARKNMRVSAGDLLRSPLFATLQGFVIAIDYFEKRANFFRFSPPVVRACCEAEITQKFGNGIGLRSLKTNRLSQAFPGKHDLHLT
jgi:hypothetical protein